MTAWWITGDTRSVLAQLPDGCVDLVATSPPFLALRSYLPDDHPDKALEIGSEPTPAAFLDTLLACSADWRRVLAPHGSICVELGDTYSGSGGAGGDYNPDGLRDGQPRFRQVGSREHRPERKGTGADGGARTVPMNGGAGWPLAKSVCFIPELYGASLAYGRNLLTGQPSPAGDWRVRNKIQWVRPNPPVGALGDKVRPATSMLTWACVSDKRWFDLDAVRVPSGRPVETVKVGTASASKGVSGGDSGNPDKERASHNPAGAPPLDWWCIPPGGYRGAHYAVFPPELMRIPIEASCPRRVCRTCGTPSRRISGGATLDAYRGSDRPQTIRAVALADEHGLTDEHIAAIRATGPNDAGKAVVVNNGAGKNSDEVKALAAEAKAVLGGYFREFVTTGNAATNTLGWTTCGCDGADGLRIDGYHTGTGWRPGIVLDPFGGSGTTALAATGMSRDAILIDLDDTNADLARERLGMSLEQTTAAELAERLAPVERAA